MTRQHVSPSQLDMYLRCGEQYRRRYMMGERVPPGVALVKGASVHKAAEVNYRQKITTGADLPLLELQDAAADYVGEMVGREGIMLTREESTRGVAKVRGEIIDRATVLTELFAKRVAPTVQPELVEDFVTIPLPGHSHDLVGRLDVVDSAGYIRDLKTAGRRKSQEDVDRSDQLTYYALAYTHKTAGEKPAGVIMDVLIDKGRPEAQRLEASRTSADATVFLNRINAMLAGVKAGSFPPAPLGSWVCSPRFCGYWWTCPYVNSERQAAAEAVDV